MNYEPKSDFEKVVDLINAFNEIYPDEEWGFAHIVLSDFNLEDDYLYAVIAVGEATLKTTHPTMLFLRLLYAIPEEKRVRPE